MANRAHGEAAHGVASTSGERLGQAAGGGRPTAPGVSCLQVITPSKESENEAERLQKILVNLNGSARRSAFALRKDAIAIVNKWGVDKTGFLTLTFGGGKEGPSVKEPQRRFDSMLTNFLGELFSGGIKVLERGAANGRVHFHCLVDTGLDVRTGTDFGALARGENSSLNAECRLIYSHLKARVEEYGFGHRVEFMPIRTSDEGIASYVSKYIAKHVWQRRPEDVGARFKPIGAMLGQTGFAPVSSLGAVPMLSVHGFGAESSGNSRSSTASTPRRNGRKG